MEELYTLSAGRWGMVISKVVPCTVEHQQGAELAVTIYCDDKLFAAYACDAEPHPTEEPDLVGFVLSKRDMHMLEVLLARVHQVVRDESRKQETR